MNNLRQLVEALDRINEGILNEDPYGTKQEMHDHLKHRDENPAYQNMPDKDFSKLGDYLYTLPVDNQDIFGYQTKKNGKIRYCKWDRRTKIFICYEYRKGKPVTVSHYMKSQKKYEAQAAHQKKGEIPKGK